MGTRAYAHMRLMRHAKQNGLQCKYVHIYTMYGAARRTLRRSVRSATRPTAAACPSWACPSTAPLAQSARSLVTLVLWHTEMCCVCCVCCVCWGDDDEQEGDGEEGNADDEGEGEDGDEEDEDEQEEEVDEEVDEEDDGEEGSGGNEEGAGATSDCASACGSDGDGDGNSEEESDTDDVRARMSTRASPAPNCRSGNMWSLKPPCLTFLKPL